MSNKKIKILIINYEYPPLGGGGGVATYDLALEWVKNAQVDVLTSSFRGLKSQETVDNINIYRVKILFRKSRDAASFISMLTYLPGAFIRGVRLMRKNRYDVINTHFAVPSGPIGYLLGRMFKVPNILSLHGGDIYDPSKKMSPHRSPLFRRVVKFILNRADHIIAQSSNTRNNAITYYKPLKPIGIIPLAFHPPKIPTVTRKELNIDKNDFILITIGRLIKRKSLDVAIRSLSLIKRRDIRLLVLGDGPEREFLENLTRELNLQDSVRFLGFVSDEEKYRYLSAADLFVLTSMHEGFGIVFMEAMFMKLPIVCTNNGGQVDFLVHEENGILIDVGDVEACGRGIMRLYRDKKLYGRCSANNFKKLKLFYADAVARQYMDLFHRSIKDRTRG